MTPPPYDDLWTEADAERKSELIALKVDHVATAEQLVELEALKQRHEAWIVRDGFRPLEAVRRLIERVRTARSIVQPRHLKVFTNDCLPGQPFLIRLRIFQIFGWHLNLHIFLRSDADEELHDHPWSFWTFVIAGGYFEILEGGAFLVRKAGSFAYRPATWRHRVQLAETNNGQPIPCATLVLTSPEKRAWGFWKGTLFTPWQQFLNRAGRCD